jgi:hypothetical protein
MYRRHGPIPNSERLLCSLWRCHQNKARPLLRRLIDAGKIHLTPDGHLTNTRVTHELDDRETVSIQRAHAGHMGGVHSGDVRRNSLNENGTAEAIASTDRSREEESREEESREEEKREEEKREEQESFSLRSEAPSDPPAAAPSKPKAKRATRLPADWKPSEADYAAAEAEGFTRQYADRIASNFRDYWLARSGAGAAKLDWPATWRIWVRREAARQPPYHGANHDGPRPQRRSATEGFDALRDAIDRGFDLPPRPV